MSKILVVDDDLDISMMLKMMLEYNEYPVTVMDRAENLVELILQNDFNLIILDMLIAGIKGTDVCTLIKSNAAIAHIPIIMITALPDSEKTCLAAGANDFLAKPFDMTELLSKIKQLLAANYKK